MTDDANARAGCEVALRLLLTGADRLGIELDGTQRHRFVEYCSLLTEGNRRANLTGVREPDAVMTALFLDSLVVDAALPRELSQAAGRIRVVDVGSGAGIPGLPLAIMRPDWSVLLLESIGKKTRFLQQTAGALGLEHVTVLQGRAEEIGRKKSWREAADLVTARAVASLAVLLEYCAPLVRTGGWLAFPKSGEVETEVSNSGPATGALHVALEAIVPVPKDLGLGVDRATVLYRKTAATPPGYPRRVGAARARPIGRY